ncbi:MAG: sugar ABC transporter ATP-binding protein [Clostridia bacterium]|nr:sugar ABC transporter ATP-binding protein [Clostridia bacterium]
MELSVKGICKSFGAGNVLDGVDFSIRGGEICALLGENGAGKTTLMNIIGGILPADAGEIRIDGRLVSFPTPAASRQAGIAFIHQELNLVNDLTVYENMFLPAFPHKGPFLDRRLMIDKTRSLFERLGLDVDPCATVDTLDASYKQTVEIAKALMEDASVIIMDEPTASLTAAEIERVFGMMEKLKQRGIAMIFISHKLDEVMRICDRYTVLRNGTLVKSGPVSEVTPRQLASYMVGRDVSLTKQHTPAACGDEVLRLEHLSDGTHFRDVSLSVRAGEVLGVTGLLGDGHSELFGSVFGIWGSRYTGRILMDGREIRPASPAEAVACGLAYLPKNRKENAVIPDMSIVDNGTSVTLTAYRKGPFFDKNAQGTVFAGQVDDLKIKMSDRDHLITTLSGGNQQKVMLSRWLIAGPKVLILDNPTQGVDVGAKEEIYTIIETLASSGIAVIVLSAEAQEIIRVCDRSLVMYHGELVGEVRGETMNEQSMMYLAAGGSKSRPAAQGGTADKENGGTLT